MQETRGIKSAILFQNTENTVFLIDTPYSIALAQKWVPTTTPSEEQEPRHDSLAAPSSIIETKQDDSRSIKHLLSVCPPRVPFSGSTEPKSDAARANVLSRILESERRIHGECILPLVKDALEEIRDGYSSPSQEWCLPRCVLNQDDNDDEPARETGNQPIGSSSLKRRRKGSMSEYGESSTAADSVEMIGMRESAALDDAHTAVDEPPIILSSTAPNTFESLSGLRGVVKNPSSEPAILRVNGCWNNERRHGSASEYIVPPRSCFVLCTLPLLQSTSFENPIPGLSANQKFNLILLDPPWPNRSVRRSGHYHTQAYFAMDSLTQHIRDILQLHSYRRCDGDDHGSTDPTQSGRAIAAIWITNAPKSRKAAYDSLTGAGFRVCEEWVWVKTTAWGQPISPLDGLWRKPYEVLVIGQRAGSADSNNRDGPVSSEEINMGDTITRRVIAAVPDLHSRKPNLKAVFEKLFFSATSSASSEPVTESYSALEVFARSLTAGWWACGDEVLKFNARECWVDAGT